MKGTRSCSSPSSSSSSSRRNPTVARCEASASARRTRGKGRRLGAYTRRAYATDTGGRKQTRCWRVRSFEWEKEESGDGGAGSGPMDNAFVSDLVNKAKTETPFVGLLVKLLSPQGVKGQLTYQEFSRVIYDNVSSQFHIVSLLPTSSFSFFFRFMQFHSLYLTTFSLLFLLVTSRVKTQKRSLERWQE